MLWISDLTFKKLIENNNEEKWLPSFPCFFSFTLNLFFNMYSPTLLTILAFSRLMVTANPLDSSFKENSKIVNIMTMTFVPTFALCLSLAILTQQVLVQMPFSLCSPFIDPLGKSLLIKCMSGIVACYQICSCVFILGLYGRLIYELINRREETNFQRKNYLSKSLVGQLTLVSLSNVLCWFPSDGIFLSTLVTKTFSVKLIIWTSVIIVPLNSLVNPMVFLVFTLKSHLKQNTKPLKCW